MLRLWDLQVVWSLPGQKALRRWIMMVRLCCCTGEMCQFWNMAFKEHMMCHSSCKGELNLNDGKCKKWGLGWELAVKCNRCSFKSNSMKVYVEALNHTSGRRSTRVNFSMQVGLPKQGISNHVMREILAATNMIPLSTSCMKKAANKTCKLIKQTNESK